MKVFAIFENNQSNSIMVVQLVECWHGHYNFVGSNPDQAAIVIKDEWIKIGEQAAKQESDSAKLVEKLRESNNDVFRPQLNGLLNFCYLRGEQQNENLLKHYCVKN